MIRLEHVSKYYASNGNVVMGLNDVTCEMHKNEIIAIVGESGSGKSTFLNVISAIDSFEDGEVYYDNNPVSGMTLEEIESFRKNHIGFIFQNYNIIDSYTVLQNVMLPLFIRGKTKKEARVAAIDIIKKVGLEKRMHHRGTKLSGGEKQRCVIARALASDSDIIACDEPTGNLDSKSSKEIIELIKSISKDRLILIVSHNFAEIKDIATRVIKFHDGKIIDDRNLVQIENNDTGLSEETSFKFDVLHQFMLALRNTFSTPKKLIFTFLVFTAVVFIWGFLFTNSITANRTESYYYSYGSYANKIEDRLVAYNLDKSELDMTAINDIVGDSSLVKNAFYEDTSYIVLGYIDLYLGTQIKSSDINILGDGKLPTEDDEIAIGISKGDEQWVEDYVNNRVYSEISQKFYNVTGVFYYYEGQTSGTAFIYGNTDLQNEIKSYLMNNCITMSSSDFSWTKTYKDIEFDDDFEDNKIEVSHPFYYEGNGVMDDFTIKLRDTYSIDLSKYDVEFVNNPENNVITMSPATYESLLNDNVFELSVYNSDKDERDQIKKDFEDLGCAVDHVATISTSNDIFTIIYDTVGKFAAVIASIFVVVVLFFLSSLVLSKLFASKSKDYTILRTLGLSRKSMAKTIIFENEITLVMALITFGLSQLIHFLIKGRLLINKFDQLNFWEILIYIVVMIIFGYLFAVRSNRKIYKLTVQTTLKKEVTEND